MKNMEEPQQRIDPEAFQRDLESVAMYNDVPWGLVENYWQSETEHVAKIRHHNSGSLLLFRAFFSLFLETIRLLNKRCESKSNLTYYTRFVPKLVHVVQQLCASELVATHGYPMPAYTLLRNTFDHIILISAAMQRITDFFKIEGSSPPDSLSLSEGKKLRVRNEFETRLKMTCKESGLSEETIVRLKLWDDLYDLEVHSSNLSLGLATDWIQGKVSELPVHPKYQTVPVAMYLNRLCEVAWMCHRLIPLLQHSNLKFPDTWANKWGIVDNRFKDQVVHFTNQQIEPVGLAIIELISKKFPFSAYTLYPLEGLEIPELCEDKNTCDSSS